MDAPPSSSEADFAPPPRYVCVICTCFVGVEVDDHCAYNIYILDLNSEGCDDKFKARVPTLRLDSDPGCLDVCALCVLNSTLYMFEACDVDTFESGDLHTTTKKRVFTLNLSDYLTVFGSELEMSMLSRGPDMMHPKRSPAAVPTPDGEKILVFSTTICFDPHDETGKEINFEFYVPAAKLWEKLPGICDHWDRVTVVLIVAWAFVTKSILLVQTNKGVFSLDLESLDEGWKQREGYAGVPRLPFYGPAFVFEDDLLFTSFGAFDIKDEDGFSECLPFGPPPFPAADDLQPTRGAMALVDEFKNGECNFYILEAGLLRETGYPYLIIEEFSSDVIGYREHKKKAREHRKKARLDRQKAGSALSTRINKTSKFLLEGQQLWSIFLVQLFSIRPGIN